jgi:hypothetical protein
MDRRKKKALSILAAAGLMGLAFAATRPALAHAGTNGQQIAFCNTGGSDYQSVAVEGNNQNGQFVQYGFNINPTPGACTIVKDRYYVGNVTLTWQQSASGNSPRKETSCSIPKESPLDTVACTSS